MRHQDYQIFHKIIKRLDPKEELVKIDLDKRWIAYGEKIKQHRKITLLTDEEIVRAYVVVKLVTQLKYSPDCIELEKEHVIGRYKKKTSARIDVLVKKNDGTYNPFMIIEVKAPSIYDEEMEEIRTQLFQVANLEKGTQYLIYYTAYVVEQQVKERVVSISFNVFDSYSKWEKEGKPNLMNIPKEYGLIEKPVFTKGGIPDLREDVTKEELERIRKDLHNVLWGGGRYHGNEIFNFIMKLFLAKIYDEKEATKAYDFQIFFENGISEAPEKTYKRVNDCYKNALKRYLLFSDDDVKDRDVRKIGDKTIDVRKVKYVVESFQDISLTKNVQDILGDFFERFLWSEFKQSKGQFFTHPYIVNFIIQVLELDKFALKQIDEEVTLPLIIDPACGSGTFLIEAMKTITRNVFENKASLKKSQSVEEFFASNFPEHRKYAWAEKFMYGLDYNEDLSMATKVNMVMHGDGSGNIESEDALLDFDKFDAPRLKIKKIIQTYPKPVNEQFDVILSNPPFSIKLSKEAQEELPKTFIDSDKAESENLFIQKWYQLLKPYGRLGVVLPESVFDTAENRYVRLFIYKYFWVKAIVALPTLAFEPYTSTRTSLFFAQKKTEDEVKEYENLWQKHKEQYQLLKKDLFDSMKQINLTLEDTKNSLKTNFIDLLGKYIQIEFDERDEKLELKSLKEKYRDQIKEVDEDWWVFSKVAKDLNYAVPMIEVKEIGYKRTLRSERERPNQLFKSEIKDNKLCFIVNVENPENALDYLRGKIKWES